MKLLNHSDSDMTRKRGAHALQRNFRYTTTYYIFIACNMHMEHGVYLHVILYVPMHIMHISVYAKDGSRGWKMTNSRVEFGYFD